MIGNPATENRVLKLALQAVVRHLARFEAEGDAALNEVGLALERAREVLRQASAEAASRRFHLLRAEDPTGVSGTGKIAEGVEFSTGECVLNWLTAHRSQSFYSDAETLLAIHGHDGKTRLMWDDA